MGFNSFPITGSSSKTHPSILYSIEFEEELKAKEIFDRACDIVKNLTALVESERLAYSGVVKGFLAKTIGRTDKLEKQKREKETLNHFGDIHLDFPLNDTTRPLLEHFTKYGYSYLSYLDGKVEFASITSQFKNANDYKKIQEHLIHLNSLAALSYISELRNERLIDCKVFNGFEALPLTIGLSSLIP